MPEIHTEFLFTIELDFEFSVLGDTPYGVRRIARLKSGKFDGPKLKGTILPGGGAWTLVRRDDVLDIEVRLLLETSDKHQIYMHWGATPVRSRPFSDLANRREGSRDQQLIFLAKRAHAALWRPRPTGRAGLSADAVPLDGVLIGPDVNELVQPTQFACPASRQWR